MTMISVCCSCIQTRSFNLRVWPAPRRTMDARRPTRTSLVTVKTSGRINQYCRSRLLHTKTGLSDVLLSTDEECGRDAVIKAVKRVSKKDVSVKRFKQNPDRNNLPSSQQSIEREIAILKSCNHVCHVELLEVIDDPSSETVYIALEYLSGGPITWEHSGRPTLTVEQSRRIIRDVVVGLEYLHYHGIIHRDIKPANIIWSANRSYVKIIDYGISHFSESRLQVPRPHTQRSLDSLRECSAFHDDDLLKVRGTGYFYAPEVIWFPPDATPPNTSPLSSYESIPGSQSDFELVNAHLSCDTKPPITPAVDVWCLGVTACCFFFGRFPFNPPPDRSSHFALNRVILQQDWHPEDHMGADAVPTGGGASRQTPGHVMNMLDLMLQKDPTPRISIDDLKRHPWILEGIHDPSSWLNYTAPAIQYRRGSLSWLRRPLSALQGMFTSVA